MLLAQLEKVRAKKIVVENDYGPAKPAVNIDQDSLLFNGSDFLHQNKLASAMEERVKEGEAIFESSGHVIGNATIDMRIKKIIWEGSYVDLGWLAPSCDLKFIESKSALGRNSLRVKPVAFLG